MKPFLILNLLFSIALTSTAFRTVACDKTRNVIYHHSNKDKTVTASKNMVDKSVKINNFNNISISSIINVVYTQQSGNSTVRIKAPDNVIEYITAEVKDKTLTLRIKDININANKDNIITCYVSSDNLNHIDIAGAGEFRCNNLNAGNLKTTVAGSGEVHIDRLRCEELKAMISGSGEINIGSIDSNTVSTDIAGSGELEIKSLNTSTVIAQVTGSGELKITNANVTNVSTTVTGSGELKIENLTATKVSAQITGSGELSLKGHTDSANLNVSGSGEISARHLSADNVIANAAGAGDIKCYAKKTITASASANSSVTYWGSPSSVNAGKNVKSR